MKTRNKSQSRNQPRISSKHRGSTLLIVVALMGMLAFLGFAFYTLAMQERANALSFSQETKATGAASLDSDGVFESALEQLLLGPDDSVYNSVLWGGRHSLVPNMVGRDGIPFNGEGVNLASSAGLPVIDRDYNGSADTGQNLLNVVDSPAANSGTRWGSGKSLFPLASRTIPEPDTDYSYPDINHMALSYDGFALDASNGRKRVFIPSFLRPQYLRTGSTTIADWYNNPGAVPASKSFRPHPDHEFINNSGTTTGVKRFVATQTDAIGLGLRRPFSFQPIDDQGSVINGGKLGVWTSDPELSLNLDVDTDGDGIRESILMDLGYPAVRRGDGKLVVPLFAIQVRDLNGLINLNASNATNTKNPTPPDIATQEFGADAAGTPRYLSSSNQGQTPFEINSVYGLTANPTLVSSGELAQHRYFLKSIGADQSPRSVRELANIEWFFKTNGRIDYNPSLAESNTPGFTTMSTAITGISTGLLGDPSRMLAVMAGNGGGLPGAGVVGNNDNANNSTPTFPFSWTNPSAAVPNFGVPLDYQGAGDIVTNVATDYGKQLNFQTRTSLATTGPNRWLAYKKYHTLGDVALTASTFSPQLLPASDPGFNHLQDDAAEIIVDGEALVYAKTLTSGNATRNAVENDAVFGPLETGFLHESETDSTAIAGVSRLADLMPINMLLSSSAKDIRPQFTTVSLDRREYSKATTTLSGASSLPALAVLRSWESDVFNYTATRPYRPLVWYHMSGVSSLKSKQFRLSVNQLLVDQNGDPFPIGVPTTLAFRDLIAHPTTGVTNVAVTPVAFSMSATGAAQEYLARRDRQALARDIYVLLYLYGGNQDDNALTTAGSTLYTDLQLKEMAQYAANLVDASDRDNVMTRFEYDKDLSNGWGLDDDPYTTSDAERAEVWGVEQQQLTLSEALAIKADQVVTTVGALPYDHPATGYDDKQDRFFTYIDLQSSAPYHVPFTNESWQIRLLPKGTATPTTDERRLTLLTGQVNAGSTYSILSASDSGNVDGMGNPSSYFMVDPNYVTSGAAAVQMVAPRTVPTSKLDLIADLTTQFRMTDGTDAIKTARGDLLNTTNADAANVSAVIVTLMRRANPYRTPPTTGTLSQQQDNPWIEVDRIKMGVGGTGGLKAFTLAETTDSGSTPSLSTKLKQLTSRYRSEPFAADAEADVLAANASPASGVNYLGGAKPDLSVAYPPTNAAKYAQVHLDRPFASLGELFELPVTGPGVYQTTDLWYESAETWHLTKALGRSNKSPQAQSTDHSRGFTGYAKFLQTDNRWYRLLEFLEVPSPLHRHPDLLTFSTATGSAGLALPTNFGWPRTPGLLNPNMIRHPNVLAGLLDDNRVLNLPAASGTFLPTRDASDTATYGPRDWWVEFLRSRDSANGTTVDPVTNLFVPGVAAAKPFRGFNFTARGTNSVNDTVLRSLPADSGTDRRALFEIGQLTEHQTANSNLDSSAKNRLISKLLNNVSPRSNSYGVFIAVQYFEAADVGTAAAPIIRVGGRITGTPTQRGFFVVDRTGVVEQFKNLAAASVNPVSTTTFSLKPDTSTTATPNGVDWQRLVLFRQTLN